MAWLVAATVAFCSEYSCAVGGASNFWKYELQVVDSSARRESRQFKTSFSLRAQAQSLSASGPQDARRMLPIGAGEFPTVTGAVDCVAGPCSLGWDAPLRASIAAITVPHAVDNSLVWNDRHRTRRPPPGCTPKQNCCKSSPQAARSLALPRLAEAIIDPHAADNSLVWDDRH